MATVREIVTKWGFQVDTRPLKQMQKSVEEAKSALKSIAYEAVGAATAIFATAETTAHLGKEAALSAQRAGLSVQAFQELAVGAKSAGLESEDLVMVLGKLNRTVGQAKLGNKEAAKALGLLGQGVAHAAMSGASTDVIFGKIADRIASIKDPALKTVLATEAFGRSGAQLLPMLNKGSKGLKEMADEARDLGLILDDSAIEKSKEFMHALKDVGKVTLGMKRQIGVALLEPVTEIIQAFSKFLRANREIIKQNVTGFFKGLGVMLKWVLVVFTAVGQRVTELTKPLGGLGQAAAYAFQAFALWKGLQLATSMGEAMMAASKFAGALQFVGTQSLWASVKAAAIPLLFVAGALAVVAIWEDVIGMFQGKDSLAGAIAETVKSLDPLFASMAGWGKMLVTGVLTPLRLIVTAVRALGGVVGALVGGGGWSALKDVGMQALDEVVSPFTNLNNEKFGITDALGFATHAPTADAIASTAGAAAPTNNIQNTITVSVPPGTDPHMVGDHVQDGVAKGLQNVLRPAHRALVPGVNY